MSDTNPKDAKPNNKNRNVAAAVIVGMAILAFAFFAYQKYGPNQTNSVGGQPNAIQQMLGGGTGSPPTDAGGAPPDDGGGPPPGM